MPTGISKKRTVGNTVVALANDKALDEMIPRTLIKSTLHVHIIIS
jgi:hypothetical protein